MANMTLEDYQHLLSLVYDNYDEESIKRTWERGLFTNIRCPCCDGLPEGISIVSSCTEHMVIIVNHSPYGTCKIYKWMVSVLPFDAMTQSPILRNK